jgi:ABC-type transporter Mla subunit MlaD
MRATTAALLLSIIACDRAATDRGRVEASLPQAPGLTEGATVQYRGVNVGIVERIRLTDSAVLMTMRLSRTDVPLRATDRVAIRPSGIFGAQAVQIVPSSLGRAWQPGDVLQSLPPDTLAALRNELADAIVRAGLARLEAARDSAKKPDSASRKRPSGP